MVNGASAALVTVYFQVLQAGVASAFQRVALNPAAILFTNG